LANYYLSSSLNKSEEGEKHAREAIRIRADRAAAHMTLAALLVEQRKWPELSSALQEAERAVPDNLAPYYWAGAQCMWRKVEAVRAEEYLRKYLSQEPEPDMPTPAAAHRLLGLVLYNAGRKTEGISELQIAVKLDPRSPAKDELKKLK